MSPKHATAFGIAPLDAISGANTYSLTSRYSGAELSGLERKIIDQLNIERLTVDAQTEITSFGMDKIAELHEHGALIFNDTTGYIMSIKNQARDKEHQAIVDHFTSHQIGMFARQTLGCIDVGATNIAGEVHRSLHPVSDPPPRKGFWQRVLRNE